MATAPHNATQADAQIAEMRRAWNRRLAVNLFAVVAIIAYFSYPTWGQPNFGETLLSILPYGIGVAVVMAAVNRWFVARQSRMIRESAASGR